MGKNLFAMLVGVWSSVFAVHAHETKAHVHGVAVMEVIAEANVLEITLHSPLDNLVGFEHAPRSEQQRKAVQAMEDRLRQAGTLFIPTPAAKCTAQPTELTLPFKSNSTAASQNKHDKANERHSELEAVMRFHCEAPAALKDIEVKLFEAFPRMQRLDAQMVSKQGQSAARLTPKQRMLQW